MCLIILKPFLSHKAIKLVCTTIPLTDLAKIIIMSSDANLLAKWAQTVGINNSLRTTLIRKVCLLSL